MAMPADSSVWTPERVRELIDESRHWPRYECIAGELLVTPVPRPAHFVALDLLVRALAPYVERHGLGRVIYSPAEVTVEPTALVQPDLFVIPASITPPIRAWT